jgi:flagellar M-ring protein FliF
VQEGDTLADLARLADPALRVWRDATPTQRTAIGAFAISSVLVVVLVAVLVGRPSYAVLYSNLEEQDAGAIVGKLGDLKVPYRIAGDGRAIEVPANRVHDLRLSLANQGLPASGTVGFEIFDRSSMGLSEFGEKMRYQRALQGELQRTISQIQQVQDARVHIVLPERKLYTEDAARPTASVVLKLAAGKPLNDSQVASIAHLVSSAVENLKPEDVTVVDTGGNLLSAEAGLDSGGAASASAASRLKLQREFERQVERDVTSMIEKVTGPEKCAVRVHAELNFDNKTSDVETYVPLRGSEGVLSSHKETSEQYTGGGGAVAQGMPGTSSNIGPGVPRISGAGGADQYAKSDTTSEYLVSKTVEHTTAPPGQVERLSVAVFVDGEVDRRTSSAIRDAVAVAAGIDETRGDQITVESLPFDTTAQKAVEKEMGGASARRMIFGIGKNAAAVILLLVFLVFLRSALNPKATPSEESVAAELNGTHAEALGTAGREPAESEHPEAEGVQNPQIAELVKADSEGLASAIRSWMAQREG